MFNKLSDNNMKWKALSLIIIIAAVLFFVPQVQAVGRTSILDSGLVSAVSNCGSSGTACSLNLFLKLGLNIADYILGIVGALTLLMFVYGGVMMVISGGSSDRVKKGKDIIVGSVVGLAIVFSSYLIIQFVSVNLLGGTFNANLPPETVMDKQQVQPGAKCKSDYNGHCVNGGSCNPITEAGVASDCGTDSVCCYTPKPKTCADFGGECVLGQPSCTLAPPDLSTSYCATGAERCCVKAQDGCHQPLGHCGSLGDCTNGFYDVWNPSCTGNPSGEYCCR